MIPRWIPARGRAAGLVALSVVVGALIGGIVVMSWVSPSAPDGSLDEASTVTSVPITVEAFDDARLVRLDLPQQTGEIVRSYASGLLLDFECVPGDTWDSGQSVGHLSQSSMILIDTEHPPVRDLGLGDSGRDVEEFQHFLERQGINPGEIGTISEQTLSGWVEFQKSVSAVAAKEDTIPSADFVWITGSSITIKSCEVQVNQQVNPGEMIAQAKPGLTWASFSPPASSLSGGLDSEAHVVEFAGVSTSAETENITDQEFLDALAGSPEYQAWETAPDDNLISATYKLQKPIDVWKTDARAVFTRGTQSCIAVQESDGQTRAIHAEILASHLGQVLLRPREGKESSIPTEALLTVDSGKVSEVLEQCS